MRKVTLILWGAGGFLVLLGIVLVLSTDAIHHRTDTHRDGEFKRSAYDLTGWYVQKGDLQGVRTSRHTAYMSELRELRQSPWSRHSDEYEEKRGKLEDMRVWATVAEILLWVSVLLGILGSLPPHRILKYRLVLLVASAAIAFLATGVFGLAIDAATERPTAISTSSEALEVGTATAWARVLWILSAAAVVVGWWRRPAELKPPKAAPSAVPDEPEDVATPSTAPAEAPPAAPSALAWRLLPLLAAAGALVLWIEGGVWTASASEGRAHGRLALGFTSVYSSAYDGFNHREDSSTYSEILDDMPPYAEEREDTQDLKGTGVLALVLLCLSLLGFVAAAALGTVPGGARAVVHGVAALVLTLAIVVFAAEAGEFTGKHMPRGPMADFGLGWAAWLALVFAWGSFAGLLWVRTRSRHEEADAPSLDEDAVSP